MQKLIVPMQEVAQLLLNNIFSSSWKRIQYHKQWVNPRYIKIKNGFFEKGMTSIDQRYSKYKSFYEFLNKV